MAKWFLDERDSEDARRLRNSFATSELTLAVPSLLLYETLNVLRYAELYTRDELVSVARALSQYGFEVLEPAEKLYEETARLSIECNIIVYDAAYVAVASHLDAPLYTADAELVNKQLAKHIKTFKAKS